MSPSGFVIVPTDDWIAPILVLVPKGCYSVSDLPLEALVERDMRGRMAYVRSLQGVIGKSATPSDPVCRAAYEKWLNILMQTYPIEAIKSWQMVR